MLKALAKAGATEPRVLAKLEIADRKAINRERLILLRANLTAMEDGEATADELFPKAEEPNLKVADVVNGNGKAPKPRNRSEAGSEARGQASR